MAAVARGAAKWSIAGASGGIVVVLAQVLLGAMALCWVAQVLLGAVALCLVAQVLLRCCWAPWHFAELLSCLVVCCGG